MPAGRPTQYRAEYCELVVEYCSDGYSLTAFAGHIGVSRQSIFEWTSKHPDFAAACQKAKAGCAAWWEARLRERAIAGEGSATAAIFGVKNMAPDDWADRQQTEVAGSLEVRVVREIVD